MCQYLSSAKFVKLCSLWLFLILCQFPKNTSYIILQISFKIQATLWFFFCCFSEVCWYPGHAKGATVAADGKRKETDSKEHDLGVWEGKY